jgi:hypothetical protein
MAMKLREQTTISLAHLSLRERGAGVRAIQ